jgi:hypothetical protein
VNIRTSQDQGKKDIIRAKGFPDKDRKLKVHLKAKKYIYMCHPELLILVLATCPQNLNSKCHGLSKRISQTT